MEKRSALIFDMDDTLLVSKSFIYVYHPVSHECVDMINSREYVRKRGEIARYYQEGYFVDTHEFGENDRISYEHLSIAKPVKRILRILQVNHREGETDLYLVTGRGNQPETLQQLFLERFCVEFPLKNIYPVGHKPTMDLIWQWMEKRETPEVLQMLREGAHATNRKKIALYEILQKGYEDVTFYEDDPENIECFNQLVKEMNALGGSVQGSVVHVS
jgi:hypothetical protein